MATLFEGNEPMAYSRRILLVEDDSVIALGESTLLRRSGYEVLVASSGESAVDMAIEDSGIGLVLMDYHLGPGIDGLEAARRILDHRRVPMLFLTAANDRAITEGSKALTGRPLLPKHLASESIIEAVKSALGD